MESAMKKINWNILNIALWCEVLLAYLLPFNIVNDFEYQVGFPLSFLSVYDTKIGVNPFSSMHVNPIPFILNVFVIYFVILMVIKVYQKLKANK